MNNSSDIRNVMIIGGSGFLSGTVAQMAVAQGYKVWTLTRGQRPIPNGVISLVADRHNETVFEQAVIGAQAEWDLVIDCIGFKPQDIKQDIAVFSNLARHLVFVSTDFVYSPLHRQFPQPEESTHYQTEGYAHQKRLCELELINSDTGPMVWTIVRPGHIYGPKSKLGCLPAHSRDSNLIARLKAGEALKLVGGGHFLQQPILARDLANLLFSIGGNKNTFGQIFNAAGPDVVESRTYYQIIADILEVDLNIEEVPVAPYLAKNPEAANFLAHRFYDLSKLQASGVAVPNTSLEQGLREHVESLLTT